MYPIFLFLVDLVTSLGVFLIYEEYTKKIQTTIQEEKKEKKERLNIYLTPYLHILNPLAWLSLFSSNLNIISNCLVGKTIIIGNYSSQ